MFYNPETGFFGVLLAMRATTGTTRARQNSETDDKHKSRTVMDKFAK